MQSAESARVTDPMAVSHGIVFSQQHQHQQRIFFKRVDEIDHRRSSSLFACKTDFWIFSSRLVPTGKFLVPTDYDQSDQDILSTLIFFSFGQSV